MNGVILTVCLIWFAISSIICSVATEWIYLRKTLKEISEMLVKLYSNKNVFGYITTSLLVLFLFPGIAFNLFVSFVVNTFIFIWTLGIKK